MGRPSLDVKVTLTVWLAPAVTETVPGTDGVATTVSFVPVAPPAAPVKPPGLVVPPPVPVPAPLVGAVLPTVYTPLLLPDSVLLQPDRVSRQERQKRCV